MNWNEGLLAEQATAAQHVGTHARLLAGPGTGKTRTITSRIAYLISEHLVPSEEILALTFTRAAAGELRARVTSMLDPTLSNIPGISTLHSFALKTILSYGAGDRLPSPIRIADDWEERWIIEEDLKELLDLERVDEARRLINRLSADWETLEVDGQDWETRFPEPRLLAAWREHRNIFGYTLRAELVYQLKRVLEEGAIEIAENYSHILVDEYQDLNACDLSVIRSLANRGSELFVAGDDDQSIYGFRYADPEGIRRFPQEYSGSVELTLTECLRCAQRILEIAQYVVQQDIRRVEKPLTPRSPGGDVHLLRFNDYNDEAVGVARISRWLVEENGIPLERILVLIRSDRNQVFSSPIRVAFEAAGLAAAAVEDPLVTLDSPQGRVFLATLQLMQISSDGLSWRTLLMNRTNRIGTRTRSQIYELSRDAGLTFSQTLNLISSDPNILGQHGELVKTEYDSILGSLSNLMATYEARADIETFINSAFEQVIGDADSEAILEVLKDVISQTGVDSLDGLLQAISTPIRQAEQAIVDNSINIMTMHQAKGLDADAVFIIGAEDEYMPGRAVGREVDDECRLLYVSITRARNFLYMTHCIRRTGSQRHTGRTSGATLRSLTRFISGGPIASTPASEFIESL